MLKNFLNKRRNRQQLELLKKAELTPNQEEYFRVLNLLDPSPRMRKNIAAAKEDLKIHNATNEIS